MTVLNLEVSLGKTDVLKILSHPIQKLSSFIYLVLSLAFVAFRVLLQLLVNPFLRTPCFFLTLL